MNLEFSLGTRIYISVKVRGTFDRTFGVELLKWNPHYATTVGYVRNLWLKRQARGLRWGGAASRSSSEVIVQGFRETWEALYLTASPSNRQLAEESGS